MLRCFLIFTVLFGLFKSFCEEKEKPDKKIYPDMDIVRAYDKINNCSIGPEITSLDQMKDICRALIESPFCQQFKKENLKNCDDMRRIDLDYADEKERDFAERWRVNRYDYERYNYEGDEELSGKMLSCLKGSGLGIVDLFLSITTLMGVVVDGMLRLTPGVDHPELVEMVVLRESFGILKNYWSEEYENELTEGSLAPVLTAMWEVLQKAWDQYSHHYACLNVQGRVEHNCGAMINFALAMAGGVSAPIAIAGALQGVSLAGRLGGAAAIVGGSVATHVGVAGAGALGKKARIKLRQQDDELRRQAEEERRKNNKQ